MPSNATSSDIQRALELKSLGDSAYRLKNFVKARDLYCQAAKLHNLPTTRSNLSASEYELGFYDSSIINAKEAIILNDSSEARSGALHSKNQLRMCRALAILKRNVEAVDVAKELLRTLDALDPSHPTALSLVETLGHLVNLQVIDPDVAQGYVTSLPLFRPPGKPTM